MSQLKISHVVFILLTSFTVTSASADDTGVWNYTLYEAEAVRVDGELMVCPEGSEATGEGVEKVGCAGADPVSFERYAELVSPGSCIRGLSPVATDTNPRGIKTVLIVLVPSGAQCGSSPTIEEAHI
jgi:hypothetical protein